MFDLWSYAGVFFCLYLTYAVDDDLSAKPLEP